MGQAATAHSWKNSGPAPGTHTRPRSPVDRSPRRDLLTTMSSSTNPQAATERVPSPCIAVCNIDPISRYCEGCLRSIEEIGAWRHMSPDEKRSVLATLPTRKVAAGTHE